MIKLILVEMNTGATADMDLQPHFWEQDAETIADNVAMLKDQLYVFKKKEGITVKPVEWEKTKKDDFIDRLTYDEQKQVSGDHPAKRKNKGEIPF